MQGVDSAGEILQAHVEIVIADSARDFGKVAMCRPEFPDDGRQLFEACGVDPERTSRQVGFRGCLRIGSGLAFRRMARRRHPSAWARLPAAAHTRCPFQGADQIAVISLGLMAFPLQDEEQLPDANARTEKQLDGSSGRPAAVA